MVATMNMPDTIFETSIETKNLRLSVTLPHEFDEIKRVYSEGIQASVGTPHLTEEELEGKQKEALQKKSFTLTIRENTACFLIGCADIKPVDEKTIRISFWIGERYWNKGYGTELYKKLLDLTRYWYPHTHVLFEIDQGNTSATKIAEQHSGEFTSFRMYEVIKENGKNAVQRPKRYLVHAL